MLDYSSVRLPFASLLGASLLILAGCGGGGGGGGGGGLNIPAGAVTLTTTNADRYAQLGLAQAEVVSANADLALAKAEETPSIPSTIELVISQIFADRLASRSIAAGVTVIADCDNVGFGTITVDGTEDANSASGSLTFSNCDLFGIIIDGSFSFSATFNDLTGAYSASGDGSITYDFGSEQFTIAMDFSVSGNDFSGEFSETLNFSISGITDGGFLFTTTQPITGVGSDITGGQFIMSGSGGTRIRVTVVGTNLIDIELDNGSGTFEPHSSNVSIF